MTKGDEPLRLGLVSARDVIWWMACSLLGVGIFSFPRQSVEAASRGAVLAIAAQLLTAGAVTWFTVRVMRGNPGRTSVQVLVEAGGWLGRVVAGIVSLIMVATLVISYRFFVEVASAMTLESTPAIVLAAAVGLTVIYVTWRGPTPLSRTLQIVAPVFLVVAVAIYAATMGSVRPYFLIPRWTGAEAAALAFWSSFFVFAGVLNVPLFHAFVGHARTERALLLGFVADFIVLAMICVGTVGTFGADALRLVDWPAPLVAKSVTLHGFYVRRIGFFSMLAGFGWVVMSLAVSTFSSSVALAQVLGLGSRRFRWMVPGLVAVPAAVALLIPDAPTAHLLAVRWLSPAALAAGVADPLLLWAASVVLARRRRRAGAGRRAEPFEGASGRGGESPDMHG